MAAIIGLVALIIAIIYSIIVIRKQADIAWSWSHAICATLVSVMLAMATGIGVFHLEASEQDAQDRLRWKMLVEAEHEEIQAGLSGTSMNVNFPGDRPPETVPIFITFVQPIATEQAALSGKFSQATSNKLLELATAMRAYNMKATYVLQLLAQGDVSPNYPQRVAHAALNLQKSRENIQAYFNEVSFLMGRE
jgi:hypothetical protein